MMKLGAKLEASKTATTARKLEIGDVVRYAHHIALNTSAPVGYDDNRHIVS